MHILFLIKQINMILKVFNCIFVFLNILCVIGTELIIDLNNQ